MFGAKSMLLSILKMIGLDHPKPLNNCLLCMIAKRLPAVLDFHTGNISYRLISDSANFFFLVYL